MAGGYLRRVGRCASETAGSGAFVYQPTDKGWRVARKPKHQYRAIHPHFLGVADAFVSLVEAQRQGGLQFRCKLEVPVGQARADMLVTTTKPGGTEPTDYFIEVEVCYKGGQEIQKKCAAYVRAWDDSVGGFPYVVIVAPNDDRRAAMQEVVDGMGKDGELFKVCVVDRLVETIKRTAAAPKVAAI